MSRHDGDTARLPGLDLLRAIAIVWVMLFHSWIVGGLGPEGQWLSRHGWMGVDLFFVLSGYLIGGGVLAELRRSGGVSLGGFYRRRAWRILPAYGATLALYLAWPAWREAPGLEPAWKFLSFTVNLSIDYGARQAFSHAWSLCVEEHFYLVFPLLAAALWRAGSARRVVGLGAGLLLGGLVLRVLLFRHGQASDPDMARNWFLEDLYYPTWCRLDGLLFGVALAAWQQLRPAAWQRARRWADAALLAGLGLLGVACWGQQERVSLAAVGLGWPLLSLALAALVFAGAGRDSLIGRRALPGAAPLAAISYSLYLVHKPAYHLVQTHWGEALAGSGLRAFAAYGAAALAAGALMWAVVERTGLRWRDRHRPATPPPEQETPMASSEKVKGPASYFPSIEKTYGQPVEHWFGLLRAAGPLKHMELVALLKIQHGLGHGHANALVAHFMAQR